MPRGKGYTGGSSNPGIQITVEGATKGLEKINSEVDKMRQRVLRLAKSEKKTAQTGRESSKLTKDYSALIRAIEKTAVVQGKLRKANASPQDLQKTAANLRRLVKTVKQHGASSDVATVQIKKFTASLNDTGRGADAMLRATTRMKRMGQAATRTGQQVSRFGRNVKKGAMNSDEFSEKMRQLEASSLIAFGPLSGIATRIRTIGSLARNSTLGLAAMIASLVGLGIALAKVVSGAARTSLQMDSFYARIEAGSIGLVDSSKNFEFLSETAQRYGLSIQSLTQGYSKLLAASRSSALSNAEVEEIFLGVAAAASALRLNTDDVTGAFRAIEQAMSKGTIQAEELRGQLGDRLVSVVPLFAKELGVTTEELNRMLKEGQVLSDELPKLGSAFLKAFESDALKNINSTQGAMNSLSAATTKFFIQADRSIGVSEKWGASLRILSSIVKLLTEHIGLVGNAVVFLSISLSYVLGRAIAGVIASSTRFSFSIAALGAAMSKASTYTRAFGAALLFVQRAFPALLVISAITFAISALSRAFAGGSKALSTFDEQVERTVKSTESLLDQLEGNRRSFDLIPQLRKHDEALDSLAQGAKKRLREIGQERKEIFNNLDTPRQTLNPLGLAGFAIPQENTEAQRQLEALRKEEEELEMAARRTAKSQDDLAIAINKAAKAKEFFVDTKDFRYFQDLNTQLKEQTRLYNELAKAKEAGASVEERKKIADSLENEFEIREKLARFTNKQINTILNRSNIQPTVSPDNPLFREYAVNELTKRKDSINELNKAIQDLLKTASTGTASAPKTFPLLTFIENQIDKVEEFNHILAQTITNQKELAAAKIGADFAEELSKLEDLTPDQIHRAGMALAQVGYIAEANTYSVEDLRMAMEKLRDEHQKSSGEYNALVKSLQKQRVEIDKITPRLEELRKRVMALRMGADAYADFLVTSKIDKEVLQIANAMKRAGKSQQEINKTTMEFKRLLTEAERLQKRLGKTSEAWAKQITTGIERMIFATNSLKEAIAGVLQSLATVSLRAFVLDPLERWLTDAIRSLRASASSFLGGLSSGGTGIFSKITDALAKFFEPEEQVQDILTKIQTTQEAAQQVSQSIGEQKLTILQQILATGKERVALLRAILDAQRACCAKGDSGGGSSFGLIGGFASLFSSFQNGTNYVPRDGLRYLHKGEAVIPRIENQSGNARAPVTINQTFQLTGDVTEATRRSMRQQSKELADIVLAEFHGRRIVTG